MLREYFHFYVAILLTQNWLLFHLLFTIIFFFSHLKNQLFNHDLCFLSLGSFTYLFDLLVPFQTNNNKEADQRMVFPGELGVYVDNISFQRIGYSVDDRSKRTKKELHMRNQRVTQCWPPCHHLLPKIKLNANWFDINMILYVSEHASQKEWYSWLGF